MRIGTISLNINAPDFNYGAILHSWAFQQFLIKLPFVDSSEIINYVTPIHEKVNLKHPAISMIRGVNRYHSAIQLIHPIRHFIRYNKFQKFIRDHMVISSKKYTQMQLNGAHLPYDTIICESDVIWSSGYFGGQFDKTFFLGLDSMKKMKRIAYAPSMGSHILSQDQEKKLRDYLKYPQFISCREQFSIELIQRNTDKNVVTVLDPVMLLKASDYKGIIGKRIIKDDYLLLYLPVNDNPSLRNAAKSYAQIHGLRIVDLSTYLKKNSSSEVISITSAGIEEFLSCIRYASCVFTNSFHAICFSILFKREFYGFSRKYPDKIIDVCNCFGLADRYCENDIFTEKEKIDYSNVTRLLDVKREESIQWLLSCLEA